MSGSLVRTICHSVFARKPWHAGVKGAKVNGSLAHMSEIKLEDAANAASCTRVAIFSFASTNPILPCSRLGDPDTSVTSSAPS